MRNKLILFTLYIGLLCACQNDAPKTIEKKINTIKVDQKTALPKKQITPSVTDTLVPDTTKKVEKIEKPRLSAAKIQFETTTYDYGVITTGDIIEYKFRFTNAGDRPLEISDVQGSCGCTVASFPFLPFAKGEKGSIQARFDSKGKKGPQENTLTVKSNSKGGDKVLIIKGIVKDTIR